MGGQISKTLDKSTKPRPSTLAINQSGSKMPLRGPQEVTNNVLENKEAPIRLFDCQG